MLPGRPSLEQNVETTYAIGLNDIITRMFTHDGVEDLVRLLQDLYRTKGVIAINNATKSKANLKANQTDISASDVVLRFKDLWDAQESSVMSKIKELLAYHGLEQALYDLEAQFDQIGLVPEKQLGSFAHLYLRDGGTGSRLCGTPNTRTKFLARHFLEVLEYGKESGHSKKERDEKARMVKAQRMTAKAVKLVADLFGISSLFLIWRSVWLSAIDQMSDKTIKPLLQELAKKEPELHELGLWQELGVCQKQGQDRQDAEDCHSRPRVEHQAKPNSCWLSHYIHPSRGRAASNFVEPRLN